MARFVYRPNHPNPVRLEAGDDEELSPEQVAVWAQLEAAANLGAISDHLSEIAEALHNLNS